MPFCPNCKVSLAKDATICPLCGASIVEKAAAPARDSHAPVSFSAATAAPFNDELISPAERRKIYIELLSISLGIVLAVTLIVDFVFFTGLSWSRYTSLVITLLYLALVVPLLNWGRPALSCLILSPLFIAGIALWAVFSGDLSWLLVPGLSITIATEIAFFGAAALICRLKRRGLNVVGLVLAATAFLCACIDISISTFFRHRLVLSWSIIVLMAALPVAIVFFYLHYRIMSQASLRKIFRL